MSETAQRKVDLTVGSSDSQELSNFFDSLERMDIFDVFSTLDSDEKRSFLYMINEEFFSNDSANTREVHEVGTDKLDALCKDWLRQVTTYESARTLKARIGMMAVAQKMKQLKNS